MWLDLFLVIYVIDKVFINAKRVINGFYNDLLECIHFFKKIHCVSELDLVQIGIDINVILKDTYYAIRNIKSNIENRNFDTI